MTNSTKVLVLLKKCWRTWEEMPREDRACRARHREQTSLTLLRSSRDSHE